MADSQVPWGVERARRHDHRTRLADQAELVPGRRRRPDDPAARPARHGRARRRHRHRGPRQPLGLRLPARGGSRPHHPGCDRTPRVSRPGSPEFVPLPGGCPPLRQGIRREELTRCASVVDEVAELVAAGDAELGVGAVQVRGDGAGGQEQAVGDLAVGQPVAGEDDDLALLRGEPGERARRRPAGSARSRRRRAVRLPRARSTAPRRGGGTSPGRPRGRAWRR